MKRQIVYAMGDLHRDFGPLNEFINQKIRYNRKMQELAHNSELEIIILQCGDFVFFWPGYDNAKAIVNQVDFLKDGHVKIYWCDGNHEDHDALDALEQKHPNTPFIEVAPYVYFATFGSVLTLLDDTKVLFAGGAECTPYDKSSRIDWGILNGKKRWWEQEGIDEKDMQRLPDTHVDWVVSHASPQDVRRFAPRTEHTDEKSQKYLRKILHRYKPEQWFHGHYHMYTEYEHCQCKFISLGHPHSRSEWHKIIADITHENDS